MHMKKYFLLILLFSCLFFSCSKPGDSIVQQAIAAYSAQEYEKALDLFNQALDSDTNYSDELIFTFISNLYAAQDDIDNSIIFLEKALSTKPDYRGFVTLGMNYQAVGNLEKAEEFYNKAVSLDSEKGEAYASLGTVYIETKDYKKAIEFLKKGTELEPKIAVIHGHLAVAYAKNNEIEKANEELKIAEELKCDNLEYFKEKIFNE